MGITRLMHLLKEKCPGAIKQLDLKSYTGRTVACDASMSIYQFLISTQHIKSGFGLTELKDQHGNLTGHLLGLFNRSIMMMEKGVRPCWVFDGKPPEAKHKTIKERKEKKQNADEGKAQAIEDGDMDKVLKFANQSVRVTPQMTADAKELVRLLGLPVIEAPCEAEAQCSVMAKKGIVYAVATEDMDCLTFGCPILLRDFTNKDDPVIEIKLEKVLEGLEITMEQFIDICILCGCDYADSIDGIGSIKAHKMILDYKTIEGVIEHITKANEDPKKKKKYTYEEDKFNFQECRKLFESPEVTDPDQIDLKWNTPDHEGLKKFLCEMKGFSETRIDSAIKRISLAKDKSSQQRLDSFFTAKTIVSTAPGKRKVNFILLYFV